MVGSCHFQKELTSHPQRIIVWMREKFPETLIVLPSFNLLCLDIQKYRDDSDFIEYKSVHIIKIKLENQCNLIHMKEKHDLIKVSVMILQRSALHKAETSKTKIYMATETV